MKAGVVKAVAIKALTGLLAGVLLSLPALADVFDYPVKGDAQRQQALQQLTEQVQQQSRVAGQFEQRKNLALLKNPVISRGEFLLQPAQFDWHIQQPFDIAYRFADNRLERTMDGEAETVEASAEPALYGFFSFFVSLFSLSEASLEKYFTVYYQPLDDQQWVMGLKPRQAAIARSLQMLTINGKGIDIDRVKLLEASGDTTELLFSYPEKSGASERNGAVEDTAPSASESPAAQP